MTPAKAGIQFLVLFQAEVLTNYPKLAYEDFVLIAIAKNVFLL